MFKIETAPKNKLILLRISKFDAFTESWWIGSWNHSLNKWSIRTPFIIDNKIVICTAFPMPIGWKELPHIT